MLERGLISLFVTVVLVACSSSDDNDTTGGGFPGECSSPTQCASGLCLTLKENQQNKPGICTSQCTDDTSCTNGRCIDFPVSATSITKICLPACTVDADCKNGFVCTERDQGNVCLVRVADAVAPCTDDSQCTEAKAQCITASDGAKGCSHALDAPDVFSRQCTLGGAKDCPGLSCVTFKPNQQNVTGTCTMSCADDTDCPGGACITKGTDSLCLKTCAVDGDCLNGLVCVAESATSDRKVCGVIAN